MLDKLLEEFEAWATRWQCWLFSPKTLYPKASNSISSLTFFLGNVLLAYLVAVVATFGYLAIKNRLLVQKRIASAATEALAISTGMFVPYAAATFVAFFLASLVSYVAFRLLGSTIHFKDHLQLFLELSFLEPFFALVVSLALLIWPPSVLDSNDIALTVVIASLLLVRVSGFVASYFPLKALHMLRARSHVVAFFSGHLLGIVAAGYLGTLIGWIVLVALVAGWE